VLRLHAHVIVLLLSLILVVLWARLTFKFDVLEVYLELGLGGFFLAHAVQLITLRQEDHALHLVGLKLWHSIYCNLVLLFFNHVLCFIFLVLLIDTDALLLLNLLEHLFIVRVRLV